MNTLWIVLGVMLFAGALLVCWPIYRERGRLTPGLLLAAVTVIAVSSGFYTPLGSPSAPSGRDATPSVDAMVAALEQRLAEQPNDVPGWKMLGRSHLQLEQYDRSVAAFEQALEREGGNNAQTLADLGEAVLRQQDDRMDGRPAELFEAALAAQPNNPKALFYGGVAALQRGDRLLAADRWEAFLALSPPPEIQEVIKRRISEWRGEPAPAEREVSLSIDVAVSDAARAAIAGDNSVFIIARDPQQPSPPVAVARRKASELPAKVTLGNADSMIPGRELSQFRQLEVLVRISASGNPIAQPGDWYGQALVDTTEQTAVSISVDRQQQ